LLRAGQINRTPHNERAARPGFDAAADTVETLKSIMSRGLGHVERTILRMVERKRRTRQRVHFDWWDIEKKACPAREPATNFRRRHGAVLRAMHSFVRKHPAYVLIGGKGTNQLLLVPHPRSKTSLTLRSGGGIN
jgi:hypothetical protein